MTEDTFRRIALGLPGTAESAHMDHPDFRVGGKIFATLRSPAKGWGMVKLQPFEQEVLVRAEPDTFVPAKGAWGRRGCTHVRLSTVSSAKLRDALLAAWRNTAPKKLVKVFDEGAK
ncbi:MAG TPA: MmcQ/YjbR family DNA-binding protein [Thermoanaerobaculia bacterium]|nr:MmcQ/YjbR family DNA-binding protein [Thermoanaerobaculia bacterium]